jgi:hypothetical protein
MSDTPGSYTGPDTEDGEHPLSAFVDGEERYVRFARDVLGLDQLGETQKKMLTDVTRNKNSVIVSGNGVGKSYAVSILCLAHLYTNPGGSVLLTSGSYQQIESITWPTIKSLLQNARDRGVPLPGTMKAAPPRIMFEESRPEKSFRAISTRRPGSLEGRHASKMLVIVDEADKHSVTQEVIESARSSVTDSEDRFVVIGNPPKSEANSIYSLLVDDNYHTINFSSFDSHNVRIQAGLEEGQTIPGLVGLDQLREDYEIWNTEPFPGVEEAMSQVEEDEDGLLRPAEDGLDERWVRRRLGAIPDDGTQAVRPFHVSDVEEAIQRWEGVNESYTPDYDAFGVDIARGGGDRTVVIGVTGQRADVLMNQETGDHNTNRRLITECIGETDAPVVVDAVGEGSGVADQLAQTYDVTRFKSGAKAIERQKYHTRRAEALGKVGTWFDDGGAIPENSELVDELLSGARHITFEEKSTRTSYAWKATPKSELKKSDRMGRSPDLLDSLALACWGAYIKNLTSDAAYTSYGYSYG